MDALHFHARFDGLDLDARSQVGKGKTHRCMLSATKQAISITTVVGHFFKFYYMTLTGFANDYIWLDHFCYIFHTDFSNAPILEVPQALAKKCDSL